MIANLHLHSKFSDGSLWPEEVALAAFNEGVKLAALTDHDTLGGSARFSKEFNRLGRLAVLACEIDVYAPEIEYQSEILAYFPGKSVSECAATGAILAGVLRERRKRLEYYLYWARTIFCRSDLTLENLAAQKMSNSSLYRYAQHDFDTVSWSKVDLFLFLKAKGVIPAQLNYKHFKKDWFTPGRFPKYKLEKPDLSFLVRAIHSDGGFAVVPHIGHLWDDELEAMEREGSSFGRLLEWFASIGVDGIEMYWYSEKKKTEALNAAVRKKAEGMGFFFTYGSDCHGPGTEKRTIDLFSGDFSGFPTALRR